MGFRFNALPSRAAVGLPEVCVSGCGSHQESGLRCLNVALILHNTG